jgi:hypothetical protein
MIDHEQEPWHNEPDDEEWVDAATGYECRIRRNDLTYCLCGYVAVPQGHVIHGLDCSDKLPDVLTGAESDVRQQAVGKRGVIDILCWAASGEMHVGMLFNVHGSLTWSGPMNDDKEKRWWLGFDCAHAGDLSPGRSGLLKRMPFSRPHEVYRTFAYTKSEVESLAKKLSAIDEYARAVSIDSKAEGASDES